MSDASGPRVPEFWPECRAEAQLRTRKAVIVSGIGRSGTAYVAHVLRQSGLFATHEHVFRGGVRAPCAHCIEPLDVEVSGFAMPHLCEPAFRFHPVVLVVRHPLDWLRSWMKKRYAAEYLQAHLGRRLDGEVADWSFGDIDRLGQRWSAKKHYSLDLALEAWVRWNAHVAARAWLFFRVEDMSSDVIRAIADLAGAASRLRDPDAALRTVPHDINSMGRPVTPRLLWLHLGRSPWRERARSLARRFGYAERS